jgi:hypothetical protein
MYIIFHLNINYLCNQRLYITTKVVSSNPIHGEMYLMQPNVIKFDSDLRQSEDGGFLRVLRFPHQ